MRFSKLLTPTLKEAPKEAVLKSHEYLIRAGFIRQISAGIYNFLPLGKIVLEKIKKVTKEELDNAGNQEVQLGFVTPSELWQKSGRFEKYGKELLRFKDRKDNDFVLGPTHEEMMVELAIASIRSYKDLPLNLYQINTKFRDELRPRFGLLRGREFIMKDGYSFHETYEDMIREFQLMEETYKKIFTRLGLEFRVVDADSGAIGGSGSREFMVLADSGEDTIVMCKECDYASNIEAAKREPKSSLNTPPEAEFAKFNTPNQTTIEQISSFFKVDPFYTIKAIVKKAIFNGGEELVFFFLRGSDELQEIKALNALEANELIDPSEEELKNAGVVAGYIGPYALRNITGANHIIFDKELENAKNLICGANEKDCHFVGVNLGEFENLDFFDIIEVKEGDRCHCCGGELIYKKGIEVGHIFQLGTKYSSPLEANFLDKDGKSKPFVMGTYGIGISRLVAAIIEQHHDEKGCIWSKESAPFMVDIIISNIKDSEQVEYANALYEKLIESGVETILDDRAERFGPKIMDFELIGFPFGIIVGKSLKDGEVEIIERENMKKIPLKKSEVFEEITRLIS